VTRPLFGDGAGAVVLGTSPGEGRGILSSKIQADGTYSSLFDIPGGGSAEPMTPERIEAGRQYMHMEGRELFQLTVKHLCFYSMQAMKAAGLTSAELDWVIPQQANKNLIDRISQRLGYPRSKFIENVSRMANTGAASIPILLDEAVRDGRVQKGQTVLLCSLGAGLAWGASIVRM
jgi:3-oxoacyl-[acyl-carrier-protein] synthase-3